MGIIKALIGAAGGGLADQWLEVLEPDRMSGTTVFTSGVKVRRGDGRNSNTKGTDNTVSNGSVIHVYPNQFMMLVDGGKIVDYTAEEGYYTVNNSSLPSLFNGQFGDTLKESFNRIRYGGVTPTLQKVFYINLQEIKGIKFGTRNPINYFDNFYNAELFLRTHGTYSIKIKDPLKFYAEAIPRDRDIVDINDINEQYFSEFLEALQAAINQMSADGVRISFVPSKGRELSQYMSTILDESWNQLRGIEVQSVGIATCATRARCWGPRTSGKGTSRARLRAEWRRPAPTPTAVWRASWGWASGCRQAAALWARPPSRISSRWLQTGQRHSPCPWLQPRRRTAGHAAAAP